MVWLSLIGLVTLGEVGGGDPTPGQAEVQIAAQSLDEPVRVDDVDVRARRGAARVPPETELDGAEIDALGAWDVGEVLQRLNETLGGGGASMVIINGKRVANPGVFSGFPPDALVRAEVLPPGAAALYGGAPGQRVINLVLQRRFSSHDLRIVGGRPTQGGTSSLSGDLRRSAIAGENTQQWGARLSRDTSLRAEERDRDIEWVGGEGPGPDAVTLRPRVDLAAANLNLTRSFGAWSGVFSLNGQTRKSHSVAPFGADVVEIGLRSERLGAALGFNGQMVGWSVQTNLNAQASRAREDGISDRRSESQSIGLALTADRTLMDLFAGPMVANIAANLSENRSVVDQNRARTVVDFNAREARASLTATLSKANGETWSGRVLGDLLATVGGGARASSAGGGDEVSGVVAWTPRKGLLLNATWSASTDGVPEAQRFEPVYYGPPVVVFDFMSGEAVEVLPLRGGNPDLQSPKSENLSLTAAVGPLTSWSLSANLGYQRLESSNGIGSLPNLTAEVEAAFPDRFQRDGDGRLLSVDYRPLNLRSTLTEGLTTSLNFNLPRPPGGARSEATILRVALSHSFRLRSTVALLAGQPDLDRLKGDGGGISRRDARILVDARRGRWGVNASARWQGGFRTRSSTGQDGPRDLITEPFTAVDMKFSFQMTSSTGRTSPGEGGPQRRRSGGLQLALEIENLLDARPGAHMGDGSPAPGYGRDVQDPIGRTVRLSLQRRF